MGDFGFGSFFWFSVCSLFLAACGVFWVAFVFFCFFVLFGAVVCFLFLPRPAN